jgi:uncharacterized protein with HEPN domain
MKDDRLYLIYIQDCVNRIEQYTTSGREAFIADTKTQDAVLRNLQTLAESTQRLSEALKSRHPKVEWSAIAGFRNVLVHGYLGINLNRVWEIVECDLIILKSEVTAMLAEFSSDSSKSST